MIENRKRIVGVLALALGLGSGVIGCDYLSSDNRVAHQTVIPVSPEAKYLVEQLKILEAGYKRTDLADIPARTSHLQLTARLYALQDGGQQNIEELVSLVSYLPGAIYDRRYPSETSAVIDPNSLRIILREEGLAYDSVKINELRKSAPYWSALTSARLITTQQWFYYGGLRNSRIPDPDALWSEYFPTRYVIQGIYGFALSLKDSKNGDRVVDNLLEGAFANYELIRFEERFFGSHIEWVQPESGPRGRTNRLINIGLVRLKELFKRQPIWEAEFRRFHRSSDLLGLAGFLGKGSTKQFPSEIERWADGVKVLRSLTFDDERSAAVLKEYFANLR